MKRLAFALWAFATPAFANGYSDVHGIQVFSSAPCGDVIAAIEWFESASPETVILERGIQGLAKDIAVSGMMWGILLGYDAHAGGLHTEEQSTLERLRAACEQAPDQSARSILDGF